MVRYPRVDVTNAGGVSQFPDVIVRGRLDIKTPRSGHSHSALLLRQLRAEPLDQRFEVKSTAGWGLNTSGAINTETRRGSINLVFSPIKRLEIVGEFLMGERINKSRERGKAKQVQFGTTFRF